MSAFLTLHAFLTNEKADLSDTAAVARLSVSSNSVPRTDGKVVFWEHTLEDWQALITMHRNVLNKQG